MYRRGYDIDHFDVTPLMSTYLVAFLIAPFEKKGESDFYIICQRENCDKTDFAYEVGQNILQSYNIYTKIPYNSLGNQCFQQASSPIFPHNGMENWGLIFYKFVLDQTKYTSILMKTVFLLEILFW